MSKKFGEIAVEKGLITTKELETALEEQSKKRIAGENEETTLIGYLLHKTGSLDDSDLKSILKFQSTQRERYQYLETLGAGGMGVVQLVQDHLLGRQVALKQIQSRKGRATRLSAKQQMMIWRLEQEASITAILEHPNIVPLYDMQQKEDGELQFTMRKVEGDTFRSILRKKRSGDTSYDENKLLSIFFKICDAVAYAHSKGIIHRDLKPDNIMVGQFGEVYVMDWGIAKQCKLPLTKPAIEKDSPLREITKAELSLETENSTGEPEKTAVEATKTIEIEELYKTVGGMGTEGYMPPEQREDASTVTPQSDIYALGKILKECFTYLSPTEELQSLITPNAEHLKKGKTSSAKMDSIKNKLPKDIQALVEKATRTAPEERYASVQAFSKDVENYFKDNRVSVREYGFAELLQKLAKRNKKSIRLVSMTFILIFITLFFTQQYQYYQQLKQNEERLEYWRNKLKNPEEGDREQAILEINKMKKIEIWEKLIKDMEEGTEYYLHGKQKLEKDNYYKTIVEILGWLENEKSGPHLLAALQKMQQKLSTKRPVSDEQYISALTKAYADSKSQESAEEFISISLQMNKETLFLSENLILKKILKNHDLSKFFQRKCTTASDYDGRGQLKLFMGEEDLALEDFTYAIQIDPSYVDAYNAIGIIHSRRGNFAEAINNFTEAIKINPKFLHAYTNLGNTKENIDLDGAIEAHSKAIEIDPTYGPAYANRAKCRIKKNQFDDVIRDYDQAIRFSQKTENLYTSRGYAKLLNKDVDGAIEDHNFEIAQYPHSKIAYSNRATAKIQKGDLTGALEDIEKAIYIDSRFSVPYVSRGDLKMKEGRIEEAIIDYNHAIELDSKAFIAYLNRGKAKQDKGDLDDAIADYDEVIRLNPQYADAYCNRGTAKAAKGELDAAMLDYNEAIRLNPNSAAIYVNRGALKLEIKKIENAIEDFNKALNINPELSAAYLNRGKAKGDKGDVLGAMADYDLAIKYDPKNIMAYQNKATIKLNKGDFSGAIEEYNLIIKMDPKNAMAYFNQGTAKLASGDLDGAILDFDQAILLDPKIVNAYLNRGNAKYAKGEFEGAIQDYTQTIRLNPQYSGTYSNRGTAKFQLKQYEEAGKDFIQSILVGAASSDNSALQMTNSPSEIRNLSATQFDICVRMLYQLKKFQEAQDLLLLFKKELIPIFPQYSFSIEQTLKLIEKELKK